MLTFYVDGSGWNGKESKACIYIKGTDIKGIKYSRKIFISDSREFTNNYMEYLALTLALSMAKDGDVIYTDSQLIVGQVLQNWKVNYPHLRAFVELIRNKLKEVNVEIKWVPREQNIAGKEIDWGDRIGVGVESQNDEEIVQKGFRAESES
jgi:ribonuclease HI